MINSALNFFPVDFLMGPNILHSGDETLKYVETLQVNLCKDKITSEFRQMVYFHVLPMYEVWC